MDISILWMLLNGWFAKSAFDQGSNWAGWICLFFSAWYLAKIMTVLF